MNIDYPRGLQVPIKSRYAEDHAATMPAAPTPSIANLVTSLAIVVCLLNESIPERCIRKGFTVIY